MRAESRLRHIEKKLRLGKESDVVPLVIVVTNDDPNDKADGTVKIGGDAGKGGNGQKTIETS
jgi:hypothetical protein